MEGFAADVKGETVIVELRGGIKVQVLSKDVKQGERVVLAVKPETFTVERGATRDKNSILGVIERVAFEGTNMRYEVRLENQDLVVVVTSSLAGEWLNIGEKVTVSFQPSNAHLFMYPELGLREEMAVE